jgi:hypothetical protein
LYDTCDTCPLSVYIDLTCDDRLERLIISGNPSRELLEETKSKLVQEFSELVGGGETRAHIEAARNFLYYRNRVAGMQIAVHLISYGRYDDAVSYLNQSGVKCAAPENGERAAALIKELNREAGNLSARLKEKKELYESLKGKGEKPTRKYYNRLLVMLSTCEAVKMQLDRNRLTLSEFAEYINMFNEYGNQLKSIKNGRKH